jgi:hypothetical protein
VEFKYGYHGSSSVESAPDRSALHFAPDLNRAPTFFRGELSQGVAFREAISALHDVVVSDLRYKPKDRSEYLAWVERQELLDFADVSKQRSKTAQRIRELGQELEQLRAQSHDRLAPFYRARQKYFDYLYRRDINAWYVLDPVITVHPDEVFFECFSQDESSYGRLGTSFEVYKHVHEFACGTTNVDYSQELYDEFQKVRSYKSTIFEVDPSGFEVSTHNEESYKEVKIDLPDSWLRGFLQVSSAMSLPMLSFQLQPMDVHNLCFVLRRHRETRGPRSMRYLLRPGQPVKVLFEPWNIEVVCPRSIYEGSEEAEVRVWGRRRLHVLERLIPVAKSFTVHLLGTGLPSFYVADLHDMSFTLGLSGWTANDWSTAGNFDLMAPRAAVDDITKRRVFDGLKEHWREDAGALSRRLDIDRKLVLGALSAYTQAGRAIYDLNKRVYRVRELSREPLPTDRLRFSNEREEKASKWLEAGAVSSKAQATAEGKTRITGTVRDGRRSFDASLVIDSDQRLIEATCECSFFKQNKLYKGPCEHILAVRLGRDHKFSFNYFL